MRIIQLINSLHYGGAERVVATLSLGLQALGHEVTIVCLRDFGCKSPDLPQLQESAVQIVALNKPEGPDLGTLRRFIGLVRRERVDVINTHNHLVHHYGVAAARLVRIPVVNTIHGIDTLNMPPLAGMMYRGCCLLSERVVAVCAPAKEELKRRYRLPEKKLAVIENGITLRPFLRLPPRRPTNEVVFGTAGRMVAVKDHQNLIRAFARLLHRHAGCRLKLLGSGPLEQDLKALAAELRIEHAVDFCGFSGDVAGFMEELDVFVLPSKSEGLPMALVEAMASGLPVVASRVGGIPDIVRPEYGWLCPPEDPEQLAECMEACLSANRLRMGALARRQAQESYQDEVMVRNYEALYCSITGLPAGSGSQHGSLQVTPQS